MIEAPHGLSMPDDLWPHAVESSALYGVAPLVHPKDFLLHFLLDALPMRDDAVRTYFYDGNVSARRVADLVFEQLGLPRDKPLRFFEFASGYGMVTRHLPQSLPAWELIGCDIHSDAVKFLNTQIGVRAVQSQPVPEDLMIDEKADVVFALSFFSHMPPSTFGRWLRTLYDIVRPGGFLIFTTHGRVALKKNGIADDFPAEAFVFRPISEQADLDTADYGAMFVTMQWVIDELWKHVKAPLTFYREAYWWEAQDVWIVAKV